MIIKQVSDQPYTYLVTEGDTQYGTIDEFHQKNGIIYYRTLRSVGGDYIAFESKSFTAALEFFRQAIHST